MAATPNADAAVSTIAGAQDAHRLIATIREGCAPADALLTGLRMVQSLGDEARTRGAFREIQKLIERGPGAMR